MNLDFINKIPGLKDLDLSQPKTRRNLALGMVAVAMILLVIILKIATAMGGDTPRGPEVQPQEQVQRKPFTMTVPEGADRDVLGAPNMIAARESGRKGNRDLYNRNNDGSEDDPLVRMKKGDQEKDSVKEERSVREMAQEAFGAVPHQTPATAQAAAQQYEPKEAKEEPSPSKPRTVKVRQQPATPVEKVTPEQPKAEEKPKEAEPVKLRRTGGVSSLSDEWGTVEGIGSLESGDEYVIQDDDKPYKVMFLRDQKVKSGERVTLRLLEDMATDGVLIPRNTHLSAVCEIGDRLRISVTNIEIGGKIYNLDYVAFDNDGAEGLYCPESNAGRKANQAGQSAGQAAISAVTGLVAATAGSMAGNAARIGAEAVRGSGGNVTANISSGYTFYLLKR